MSLNLLNFGPSQSLFISIKSSFIFLNKFSDFFFGSLGGRAQYPLFYISLDIIVQHLKKLLQIIFCAKNSKFRGFFGRFYF